MTREEIRQDIQQRLREDAADPVFWEAADVNEAIQEALEELARSCGWVEKQKTLTLAADTLYYSALQFDERFLWLDRVFDVTTETWLTPSDWRDIQAQYRRWESARGTPDRFFMRGGWWLGLWPVPTAARTVRLYYRAAPGDLADDEGTDFGEEFQRAVTSYALADLFAQEGEPRKGQIHFKEYVEVEGRLGRHQLQRITHAGVRGMGFGES